MKTLLTWFWKIDKSIWKDNIDTNPYFGSLCLVFAAFTGACQGGGGILNNWFGWNMEPELNVSLTLMLVVYMYNLGESLIFTTKISQGVLRALLFLAALSLAFAVGYILAVVVLVAVAAIVVIYVVGSIMLGNPHKSRKYVVDENGNEIELKEGLLGGTLHGSDGSLWDENGDGTATRH